MTPLDRALAALRAAPGDEGAERAYYATLAAAELHLLLEAEPEGETLRPRTFPLETGPVALAFDTEERLAGFAGPARYATLSGRALAGMLAGRGIGLLLGAGTPEAEWMLPADAVDWLAEAQITPEIATERPVAFHRPGGFAEDTLGSIEARLASAAGLAARAVLTGAEYAGGIRRPCLVFLDPRPGAEGPLAALIGEALAISGRDPADLDLAFLPAGSPAAARALAAGLAVDLPAPETPEGPRPPGRDPDRPPKLR